MTVVQDPWRWHYRLVLIWVATTYGLIGAALEFGPARWKSANSLHALHVYLPIPWLAWACAFWLVTALVWSDRTRKAGYFVGAVLAILFVLLSLLYTVLQSRVTNPVTVGLASLSVPMLLAGIRYAVIAEEVRHR